MISPTTPAAAVGPRLRAGALAGVAIVLVLAGCAAGPGLASGADAAALPGFWHGLWHGLISPVTFIISLFTDSVSIYEVRNGGNWYDAGFMLGVSTVFSTGARSGVKAQHRRSGRRRSPGSPAAT